MKKNEGYVYHKILDKRKKIKTKFQVNNFARTTDLSKAFSKGDTSKWSYNLYKNTRIVNVTLPSYKVCNLTERYNKTLLKKTWLTMKENKIVMTALSLKKSKCLCSSELMLTKLFVNTKA